MNNQPEDVDYEAAAKFMTELKKASVYYKLSNNSLWMDAVMLKQFMSPKTRVSVNSWLFQNNKTLTLLNERGLIATRMFNSNNARLGSDPGYRLSPATIQIARDRPDDQEFYDAVLFLLTMGASVHA